MTAALTLESRSTSNLLRRARSFDVVHARRARRLLRRRAGGAVAAVLAFEGSRASWVGVPISRHRVHRARARVNARNERRSSARARMRHARPSGEASAAPDARVARPWQSRGRRANDASEKRGASRVVHVACCASGRGFASSIDVVRRLGARWRRGLRDSCSWGRSDIDAGTTSMDTGFHARAAVGSSASARGGSTP